MSKQITPLLLVMALAGVGCDSAITTVSGQIVDESGAPVSGATVDFYDFRYDLSEAPRARVHTGEDGSYHVRYREFCSVVGCVGGGDVVADAPGYEARIVEIEAKFDSYHFRNVTITLLDYDELSVEEAGIPDEQPRPVVEETRVGEYTARLPEEGSYAYRFASSDTGSCISHIAIHGRDDEFGCLSDTGREYPMCFASNELSPENSVLCLPGGFGIDRPKVHLMLSAPLPAVDLEALPEYPLPFYFSFSAGIEHDSIRCTPVEESLFTNTGERVGYECDSVPVTWTLNTFVRDPVWIATRIGSASPPVDGVITVHGRRRVPLESVQF